MKVYVIQFFDNNDGDGADWVLHGCFSSFEKALAELQAHIEKEKINIHFVVDSTHYPQYLSGALYRCSPKYGEFTIREVELDKFEE